MTGRGKPDGPGDALTDGELLARVRSGDVRAYELLWRRHVGAAQRRARRLMPSHAEDLVAEAFARVFHQVGVVGGGPTTTFRSYLFVVMRNLAVRWSRETQALLFVEDLDDTPAIDSGRQGEDEAVALSRAFRALPERWQRVLWLTEVEDVPRPDIAARLKIKPNAVSALQRRARAGLREQFLWENVPTGFRDDNSHAARVLPALLSGRLAPEEADDVRAHIASCDSCREIELQLVEVARRAPGVTVATVGVVVVGASWYGVAGSVAPAAAVTTLSALIGLDSTAKLAAVAAGVVLVVGLGSVVVPVGREPSQAVGPDRIVAVATRHPAASPTPRPSAPAPVAPSPSPSTPPDAGGSDEPPTLDLHRAPGGTKSGGLVRPTPPAADPGQSPPDPGAEDPSLAAPTVTASAAADGFVAPLLSGTAVQGAAVAVSIGGHAYPVQPDAAGSWSFDTSALGLDPGDYTALLWQTAAGASSATAQVPFTVHPLVLDGFLMLGSLDEQTAADLGIVFTAVGPAGGVVCVSSDSGQTAEIPLDAKGYAARRIRFLSAGDYALQAAVCAGGRLGPVTESDIRIDAGGFSPFGSLADPEIVVEEP